MTSSNTGLGTILVRGPSPSGVSAHGYVVADVAGVDPPVVPKRDAELFFVKRDLLDVRYRGADLGVAVQALPVGLVEDERIVDERLGVAGLDLLVERVGGLGPHDRPLLAQALAAGADDLHLDVLLLGRILHRADDALGAACHAGRAAAGQHAVFVGRKVVLVDSALRAVNSSKT